eukprot:3683235-Alexandrium_andersonii.AAC.1
MSHDMLHAWCMLSDSRQLASNRFARLCNATCGRASSLKLRIESSLSSPATATTNMIQIRGPVSQCDSVTRDLWHDRTLAA